MGALSFCGIMKCFLNLHLEKKYPRSVQWPQGMVPQPSYLSKWYDLSFEALDRHVFLARPYCKLVSHKFLLHFCRFSLLI